jgi:hypothetical protein
MLGQAVKCLTTQQEGLSCGMVAPARTVWNWTRHAAPFALALPQPGPFAALVALSLTLARNLPTTPVGK